MTTSVAVKPPCRTVSTAPLTLSGEQTVNGVALVTGDRVLVKDQVDTTANGIYEVDTSAWSRSPDFDGSLDAVDGTLVLVHNSSGPDQLWELSATNPVIIGTSALTFTQSSLTASTFGASLIAAPSATAARSILGSGTTGDSLFLTATAAAARTVLGFSTFVGTLIGASSASVFRGLIGSTTVGDAVFVAASTTAARTAIGALENSTQDFRLTLTSGLPVTTADVTGATTIYATPKTGKYIDLYDGTNWNRRTSAEFSLALGTLTSGRPYDVFCYDNAGVPTLELLAWTNDTTRATALVRQDGVLSKTGDLTRRYMGTFYTTSTTATEDSLANRYLWNYYHRAKRAMTRTEATATWPYQTATWRQANAAAANQLNFLLGVAEDAVLSTLTVSASSNSGNNGYSGIGLDSTTPTSEKALSTFGAGASATNTVAYEVLPAAGRHFLAWCEYGAGGGTLTWNGTNGESRSGMFGSVMA